MTHWYVWHDSLIRVTWLIGIWHDMHPFLAGCTETCRTWLLHIWHDSFTCVTWNIHMSCGCIETFVTRLLFGHDSFVWFLHKWHDSFVTWHIDMSCGMHRDLCDMTCVTWLIHMCHMTHSYAWHENLIRDLFMSCEVHWDLCDMAHSCLWHDSSICVTWLIHMCDTSQSYVWHDSFICMI